jgi:xanthine/CO dehydrogenase XdhC/CoxF family maturation factor
MATQFTGSGTGSKLILHANGTFENHILDKSLSESIKSDLQVVFETGKSEAKKYNTQSGVVEVFIELIQPSSVIIFGGGFDARPVSALAKSLGWEVNVTDECVAHIAPVFFPDADKLSLCQREFIERDFNITPYTACVLMSHNYEYDRDVLKKLVSTPAPYIGILGPRKRFDKMQEEFASTGFELAQNDFNRIHSPIGLDIGAETPDEIAVSIIAEIQSKFANRSGGFLKYNNGPIHVRDNHTGEVFKQVYLGNEKSKLAER